MPSQIDATKPTDGVSAVKADLRANLNIIKTESNHGGFVEGLTVANYTPATTRVLDHLAAIDTKLGDTSSSYNYVEISADHSSTAFVIGSDGAEKDEHAHFISISPVILFPSGLDDDTFGLLQTDTDAEIRSSSGVVVNGVTNRGGTGAALVFKPGIATWHRKAANVIEVIGDTILDGTESQVYRDLNYNDAVVRGWRSKQNASSGDLSALQSGVTHFPSGNCTNVRVSAGYTLVVRNKSGGNVSYTPVSGNCIVNQSTQSSVTIPNLGVAAFEGDGTDLWVDGDAT